jgi:hypothetical protein
MFMKWVDSFIGEHFKENIDLFHKARLLVGVILTFIGSIIGYTPFYTLTPGLSFYAKLAYFLIVIPVAIFWYYLLTLLKKGEGYFLTANGIIASTTVVLFAGIAITGGPLHTEVHPLLLVIVVFAALLLGKRSAILWSVIVFIAYFSFVGLNMLDFPFINLPPENLRPLLRVGNWSYAFIIIVALAMIYENINNRITEERDAEREKFKHIATVAVDSSVVTKSADSLAGSSERLLASAIQQKTAIEELAATTEQLGATAEQNTVLTKSAKSAINETEEQMLISKADILQLVESMNQVKTSSEEIQSINNVINEISYQTNILSLNAMIEASRSDSGGGFKVVALEVKRLAERSAKAADNINKLLGNNFISVQQGVNLSETMKVRFDEISAKIAPLAHTIQQVTDASFEQHEAIKQITGGLNDIDRAIEENRDLASDTAKTAIELRNNSVALMEVVAELGTDL